MKKLALAVVGCGDIAGFMALVSRLVPEVRLCACCDVNPERAQAFARRYHIRQVFSNYAELLDARIADAVYLAVPHSLHFEMIRSAIAAGLPVLVEKPLTRTLEEGLRILEAVKSAKVGINYQYRYDVGCYALARAVQKGELGKISSICINVPWHREQSYFDQAAWHKTIAQAGGGTLITQGSHFLDIALWALGEKPISTTGYTAKAGFNVEVETLAHGIVETEGGTLISIVSSMVAAHEGAVTVAIYGDRATGIYKNMPWPHVGFQGRNLRKEHPREWGVLALQRSLSGFVHWVLAEKPFLIPAVSALPVLAAVDGIYRSAQTGVREKISF